MKCAIILLAITCGVLSTPIEDEAKKELVAGNHRFSSGVYKEIAKYEHGNFIVSPISVESILAFTREGAKGETADEFKFGLHLPSTDQKTQYAFKYFLPNLKRDQDDLKIWSANKVFVGDDIKIKDSFKEIGKSVYDAGIDYVDFTHSSDAAKIINKWVEKNTNGKIRDIIHDSSYDEHTKVILINSLYFNGEWVYKFDASNTTKKVFYNAKADSVEVDTVFQIGHFNYYKNPELKAYFVELPYKGGDISMTIALPYEGEDIAYLEEHIDQVIQHQEYSKEKIAVEIPKFKTEYDIKFIPILENLGIKKAFHEGADFSGISASDDNFSINDVIQKTYISFDEFGCEATSPTAVNMVKATYDPSEPIWFKANRPFIYYIKINGIVAYTGRVKGFKIDG